MPIARHFSYVGIDHMAELGEKLARELGGRKLQANAEWPDMKRGFLRNAAGRRAKKFRCGRRNRRP
jgi:hypothetical protein